MLIVDDTGFVKKGDQSVGVARQYTGTVGATANAQIGVFLASASAKGAACVDRALYLPRAWTDDPGRCRAAGIPETVRFATKLTLAQHMLERASRRRSRRAGSWGIRSTAARMPSGAGWRIAGGRMC